jgi:hypothetical protein
MSVDYAEILYNSYETSLHEREKFLDEMEEARVNERIP